MAASKHVLLIESDPALRSELAALISLSKDYESIGVADLDAAITAAAQTPFDIIIIGEGEDEKRLDLTSLRTQLDSAGLTLPFLALTNPNADQKTNPPTRAERLEKPVHISALISRLRALIDQYERSDDAVIEIGPYSFQPAFRLLVKTKPGGAAAQQISLTDKEASILHYLYRAGGVPVSRDVLLDKVWNYNSSASTHTLETHIYRLRQKIETDQSENQILITEPEGYRLNLSTG